MDNEVCESTQKTVSKMRRGEKKKKRRDSILHSQCELVIIMTVFICYFRSVAENLLCLLTRMVMQRHLWTRLNLPREGPQSLLGYSPHPTIVKWETYSLCLLLEVQLFLVLLCSSIFVVVGYHGYKISVKMYKTV